MFQISNFSLFKSIRLNCIESEGRIQSAESTFDLSAELHNNARGSCLTPGLVTICVSETPNQEASKLYLVGKLVGYSHGWEKISPPKFLNKIKNKFNNYIIFLQFQTERTWYFDAINIWVGCFLLKIIRDNFHTWCFQ